MPDQFKRSGKYDPDCPRSFCRRCLKLDFVKKYKGHGEGLCFACYKARHERDKANLEARAELERQRLAEQQPG